MNDKRPLDVAYGLTGLPTSLTQHRANRAPALFSLIGLPNREARKELARVVRKKVAKMAGSDPKKLGSDDEVLLKQFIVPEMRIRAFWEHRENFKASLRKGFDPCEEFGPSILHSLLALYDCNVFAMPADRERMKTIEDSGISLQESIDKLKEDGVEYDENLTGFLSIWPRLISDLENWDAMLLDRRDIVANAIFAVASAMSTPEFMSLAVALRPELAEYYADLENADDSPEDIVGVSIDEAKEGPVVAPRNHSPTIARFLDGNEVEQIAGSLTKNNSEQAEAMEIWHRLTVEVARVSAEMLHSPLSKALADELAALSERYQHLPYDLATRESFAAAVENLFSPYRTGVDAERFRQIVNDIDQIRARWLLLAHDANSAALREMQDDIPKREQAARNPTARYLLVADELNAAIAACEKAQREFATASFAAKISLRAALKEAEATRDTIDDRRTEILTSLFQSLNYDGEQFDVTRDWVADAASIFSTAEHSTSEVASAPARVAQEASAASSENQEAVVHEAEDPTAHELFVLDGGEAMPADAGAMPAAEATESAAIVSSAATVVQSVEAIDEPAKPSALFGKFWAFIAAGEYGIAYNLAAAAEALDAEDITLMPPSICARLIALGAEISYPQGAVARAVEDAVATFDPTPIANLSNDHLLAANLLLVAGTLRAALLAPATGAPGVLREVSLGPGWDSLHKLTQEIASSSDLLHGVSLGPDAFRQVKHEKSMEHLKSALKAEGELWLDANAKSRLSFQPATAVWHHWVGKDMDGRIYRLLAPVVDTSSADDEEWKDLLADLADPTTVETMVQATDRELRGSRFGNIDYKALDQLHRRVAEAVHMVRRWMALNDTKPRFDFIERNIRMLADKLEGLRKPVASEVEAARAGVEPAVRAVAYCLERELSKLWSLFDPSAQGGTPEERSPTTVLNEDMLRIQGVHIDATGQIECAPNGVLGAISNYSAGSVQLDTAVETKICEGDFDAADRLIERLAMTHRETADGLRMRFDAALAEAKAAITVALADASKKLESGFRAGLVSDVDRDRMAAELAELELKRSEWRRFDKSRQILDVIDESISSSAAERISGIRERFSRLALAADDERRRTIEAMLANRDAFAAEEYIDHVARGETPPSSVGKGDGENCFAAFLAGITENVNLPLIEQRIRQRQDWGPAAFSGLSEDAQTDAAGLIHAWNAVKRLKSGLADPRFDQQAMTILMSAIGFRPSAMTVGPGGRVKTRIELSLQAEAISDRRICPIPEFGSEAKGSYRIVCVWPKSEELDATEVTSQTRASAAATVVLFMGTLSREGRQKLLRQNLHAKRAWLLIDDVMLLYLATQVQGRLAAFFRAALPYSAANPYRVKVAGTVQPEMFFGRAREREAVVAPQGASFVYGGRQLGKTALIKEVERLLHRPPENSIVLWLDLPGHSIGRSAHPENLWTLVVRELHRFGVMSIDWPDFKPDDKNIVRVVEDIRKWVEKHPEGRILLLLDEADEFLREDATTDYAVTRVLKSLMERTGGYFKTVFVGLHNVLRSTQHANNPLVHLGAVEVGPLYARGESREAFEMVRGPFAALGFTFADDSLILRILGACNYYPVLINFYCRRLLERLRDKIEAAGSAVRQIVVITEAMVSEIYDSTELRDEIKHYFLATLALDTRYILIANWLAFEYLSDRMDPTEGAGAGDIRKAARGLWPEGFRATSDQEFDALLAEMVGLGVLRHTDDHCFTFRNLNVLQLVGTKNEIDDRLTSIAVDGEIKPGFDATTFRGPLSTSPHSPNRSPFTITQEAQISAQENGVNVVCGAALSEIGSVAEVLSHRHAVSNVVTTQALSIDQLMKDVEHLRANPKPGVNLLLIPETRPWSVAWVDTVRHSLLSRKSTASFVRVVFLAGANQLWARAKEGDIAKLCDATALPLKPWTDSYLWTWLEDINIPPERALRKRILMATDGRPGLIMQLHADLDQGLRINERVDGFIERLVARDRAAAILAGLGVVNDEAVKGLRLMAELAGETLGEITKLWDEMGVQGFTIENFVRWAETLLLVRPSGTDRWEVEPFVVRMLKAAADA